jgi:hypothetical protein
VGAPSIAPADGDAIVGSIKLYEVSVIGRQAGYCFTTWDRLAVAVWRLGAAQDSVAEMSFVVQALMAMHDERCCFLGIVEPTSPPPDERTRAALAKFSREVVPSLAVAIIVGEGGGFRASLVRAVGVALTTLMPHRVPFKFLGSAGDAIAHIVPHLSPGAGGVRGLERALVEVRAQFPVGIDPVPIVPNMPLAAPYARGTGVPGARAGSSRR